MEEEVLDKMKEKQTIHKKVKDIKYEKLESQAYMRDGSMTNNMVRTLTALRSSMVRGVRANFVSSSVRTQCPLQCRDTAGDTQSHLLECPVLLARLTIEEEQARDAVEYNHIFGNLQQQRDVTSIIVRLLEVREEELEARTGLPAGDSHRTESTVHIVDYGNK